MYIFLYTLNVYIYTIAKVNEVTGTGESIYNIHVCIYVIILEDEERI